LSLESISDFISIKYDSKNVSKDIDKLKEKGILDSNDIIFITNNEKMSIGNYLSGISIEPNHASIIDVIPRVKVLLERFSKLQRENKFTYSYNQKFIESMEYLNYRNILS
jgi:hypothetical protein